MKLLFLFIYLFIQIRHSLAIARLYLCKEGENKWKYTGLLGVAAIVTEANLQNNAAHFLRLVDIHGFNPNKSVIFEQEIYPGMEYHKDTNFFHSFEVDGYMAGFSFVKEEEADFFYKLVHECIDEAPNNTVNNYLDGKEESFIAVGDNFVSKKPTDGYKVNWIKPAPSQEILNELGSDEKVVQLSKSKGESIINLIENPQPAIPENIAKFSSGNKNISDGIEISWSKNCK